MQRLGNLDEIINYIKTFKNPSGNMHVFNIKKDDGNYVIRTVSIFKNTISIKDYEHDDNYINAEDNIDNVIVEYDIAIPIDLYKSCAIKEKAFILQYNLLKKMKQLDEKLFYLLVYVFLIHQRT